MPKCKHVGLMCPKCGADGFKTDQEVYEMDNEMYLLKHLECSHCNTQWETHYKLEYCFRHKK